MHRISIEGPFDISACNDCMAKDTCSAYSFAGSVVAKVDTNVSAVKKRITNAFDSLYLENNADGRTRAIREIEIAMRRIPGTVRAFAEAQEITTTIISRAVQLQMDPDTLQETEISFSPAPPSVTVTDEEEELPSATDIAPHELDKIGTDIRYYTSTGICGAIAINEEIA